MDLITDYKNTLDKISTIKKEIIDRLVENSKTKPIAVSVNGGFLHTIKFTQLKKWGVSNYLGGKLQDTYSYNLIKNIEASKNLVVTLSNMLICGNMTNYSRHYFMKLKPETINEIYLILGDNIIIPKLKRNISGSPRVNEEVVELWDKYPHLKEIPRFNRNYLRSK